MFLLTGAVAGCESPKREAEGTSPSAFRNPSVDTQVLPPPSPDAVSDRPPEAQVFSDYRNWINSDPFCSQNVQISNLATYGVNFGDTIGTVLSVTAHGLEPGNRGLPQSSDGPCTWFNTSDLRERTVQVTLYHIRVGTAWRFLPYAYPTGSAPGPALPPTTTSPPPTTVTPPEVQGRSGSGLSDDVVTAAYRRWFNNNNYCTDNVAITRVAVEGVSMEGNHARAIVRMTGRWTGARDWGGFPIPPVMGGACDGFRASVTGIQTTQTVLTFTRYDTGWRFESPDEV